MNTRNTPDLVPVIRFIGEQLGHDFDALDAKGRAIGALVSTWTEAVMLGPVALSETACYMNCEPVECRGVGTFFMLRVHATRNGKAFGASQSARQFETAAARDMALSKYLNQATGRAIAIERKANLELDRDQARAENNAGTR